MKSRTSATLPPQLVSARRARIVARDFLSAHGLSSDDVELVVSELVANVVLHARSAIEIVLEFDRRIRLEVADGSAILPAIESAAADAERGRGLAIVEAMADRWGIASRPDGKCVWAEFLPRTLS